MSKREAITRYSLVIQKLRKKPCSFNEIAEYLTQESEIQSYNYTISKRTFQRDIADILSIYNIEIRFDTSRKVYFIDDSGQPEIHDRMLEAFDTLHALNMSEGLSKYIHFEKRKPQGTDNLYGLLHAIKNKLVIRFSYHKFWEEELTIRKAEPYALKEFKNRWYVLAKDCKDNRIKNFALDRLTDLEIGKATFTIQDSYNVEESYNYCFGIISPEDEEPQEIILSFDPFQGKYIKTLPLHDTQQVLTDDEYELKIILRLYLTHDFLMELLSYGDNVKVIEPQSLVDQVRQAHEDAFRQY